MSTHLHILLCKVHDLEGHLLKAFSTHYLSVFYSLHLEQSPIPQLDQMHPSMKCKVNWLLFLRLVWEVEEIPIYMVVKDSWEEARAIHSYELAEILLESCVLSGLRHLLCYRCTCSCRAHTHTSFSFHFYLNLNLSITPITERADCHGLPQLSLKSEPSSIPRKTKKIVNTKHSHRRTCKTLPLVPTTKKD